MDEKGTILALHNDLERLNEYWNDGGLTSKLILSGSIFFTLSSLLSIADHIVKFKGYTADALVFYREHVASLIVSIFELIDFPWSPKTSDFFVLIVMLFCIPTLHGNSQQLISNESGRIDTLFKIFFSFAFAAVYGYLYSTLFTTSNLELLESRITGVVVFTGCCLIYYAKFIVSKRGNQLVPAFPLLIGFYGTLIIAQLNKGLSML